MKLLPLSIDMEIVGSKNRLGFYANLCLTSFQQVKHFFSSDIQNKIEGDLRRGDLTACQHPSIEDKLSRAKAFGDMSTTDFRQLYQFYSLTKKLALPGDEKLCKANGLAKLLDGEAKCKVTNMTIEARISSNYALFDRVKMIIQDIIGDVPATLFTGTEVKFGPGSTVNLNRRSFEQTGLFYKLTDRLIVPERAKFYLAALVSSNPNWVSMLATHYRTQKNEDESYLNYEMRVFNKHFEIVPDSFPSRIGFVPKDSDEFRTIGIEMNGLMPLQMCIGNYFSSRLYSKVGINLNSQERNRHLAKLAKLFGLATIDLKNASGSIALLLVKALFPVDWYCLIEACRSTHGSVVGGEIIEYEMVSSMGNGFTFELESLIFYALAKATCEDEGVSDFECKKSLTVFGDDIILPQRCASTFMQNLTLFGFTANKSKSFIKGFFFESCGNDYYNSTDVRPFFLKRTVSTLKDFYFLLNSLLYKVIQQERSDLLDIYKFCYGFIAKVSSYGPLHFNLNDYGKVQADDLEAVLRVPLEFAQTNGGVVFNYHIQAWQYKKWINIALLCPLSKSSQYAVQHARYMTFLRGTKAGEVALRGRVKSRQITDVTSAWDGHITVKATKILALMFESLEPKLNPKLVFTSS